LIININIGYFNRLILGLLDWNVEYRNLLCMTEVDYLSKKIWHFTHNCIAILHMVLYLFNVNWRFKSLKRTIIKTRWICPIVTLQRTVFILSSYYYIFSYWCRRVRQYWRMVVKPQFGMNNEIVHFSKR